MGLTFGQLKEQVSEFGKALRDDTPIFAAEVVKDELHLGAVLSGQKVDNLTVGASGTLLGVDLHGAEALGKPYDPQARFGDSQNRVEDVSPDVK